MNDLEIGDLVRLGFSYSKRMNLICSLTSGNKIISWEKDDLGVILNLCGSDLVYVMLPTGFGYCYREEVVKVAG